MCILVATSGDTGKAALEGFRDVERTRILVFYPKDGVSAIQELQMVTQEGDNVGVCSVVGNFDDAQTGVKKLFSDRALAEATGRPGLFPVLRQLHQLGQSAATDRILCLRLLRPAARAGRIQAGRAGERVRSHGQLRQYPGWLLRQEDGGAHRARSSAPPTPTTCSPTFCTLACTTVTVPFYNTMSPSMDILISSNLERLLFETDRGRRRGGAGLYGPAAIQLGAIR